MKTWDGILFAIFLVAVAAVLIWMNRRVTKDLFTAAKASCNSQRECERGQICYQGECWDLWDGNPLPWNSCVYEGKLSPYCNMRATNQPSGLVAMDPYPACGGVCSMDSDCAPGCPKCRLGRCTSS